MKELTQSCHHIETNQLIGKANQLTGFYMMVTLTFNELILEAAYGHDPLEIIITVFEISPYYVKRQTFLKAKKTFDETMETTGLSL